MHYFNTVLHEQSLAIQTALQCEFHTLFIQVVTSFQLPRGVQGHAAMKPQYPILSINDEHHLCPLMTEQGTLLSWLSAYPFLIRLSLRHLTDLNDDAICTYTHESLPCSLQLLQLTLSLMNFCSYCTTCAAPYRFVTVLGKRSKEPAWAS